MISHLRTEPTSQIIFSYFHHHQFTFLIFFGYFSSCINQISHLFQKINVGGGVDTEEVFLRRFPPVRTL